MQNLPFSPLERSSSSSALTVLWQHYASELMQSPSKTGLSVTCPARSPGCGEITENATSQAQLELQVKPDVIESIIDSRTD
jgi:hypothetical protein